MVRDLALTPHEKYTHQKYCFLGPIIRINPDELSINDPNFYKEIYVTEYRRRTEHYDAFAKGLNFDGRQANPTVSKRLT